jgi:hypothetical protein
MLPEDKFAPRFEQFPDIPHNSTGILNRTKNLDTNHSIDTPLRDPLFLQGITIFNAREDKLIPVPKSGIRLGVEFSGYRVRVVSIRLDAVDIFHTIGVEAVDLVSGTGTQVEDYALGGLYERGDDCCVFEGDEVGGWPNSVSGLW